MKGHRDSGHHPLICQNVVGSDYQCQLRNTTIRHALPCCHRWVRILGTRLRPFSTPTLSLVPSSPYTPPLTPLVCFADSSKGPKPKKQKSLVAKLFNRKSWLFIAYQFSLPHLYISLENVLFDLGSESVSRLFFLVSSGSDSSDDGSTGPDNDRDGDDDSDKSSGPGDSSAAEEDFNPFAGSGSDDDGQSC